MAHGRKRWLPLAAPATTLIAGVAAWASLSFNLGFTGSVTGQDAPVSAKFTSATPLSLNDSHCTWSVDASGKLVLTASKVPSGGSVACATDAVIDNPGSDVDLRVQRFGNPPHDPGQLRGRGPSTCSVDHRHAWGHPRQCAGGVLGDPDRLAHPCQHGRLRADQLRRRRRLLDSNGRRQ